MDGQTHKHSCECEHDHVRFCKKCQVVHCLDCNKEWRNNINWNYLGQYTTPSYPSYPWYSNITLTNSAQCVHGV